MLRTIKDLSEGQIIYLDETVNGKVSHVPYIYLGLDEIGNAIILRKEFVRYERMNNVNIAEYIGCEMDLYLNNMRGELWKTANKQGRIVVDYTTNGFLSRFDEAIRNALTRTKIKHYALKDKTTVILDRECFLLSYTNLGFAKTPDEGKSYLNALKIANNTTNDNEARIGKNSAGVPDRYWMSSEFLVSQFRYCDFIGNSDASFASYKSVNLRPVLSLLPSTIISEYECDFVKI